MSKFNLIIKYRDIYSNELINIYKKNFGNNSIFYPYYKYFMVCTLEIHFRFTLTNEFDEIIGECSITDISKKKSNLKTFEFHDVFIFEKFRSNNYAQLMLLNVLYWLDQKYGYYNYIIKALDSNYPAIKTYTKICGKPYIANGFATFQHVNIENN